MDRESERLQRIVKIFVLLKKGNLLVIYSNSDVLMVFDYMYESVNMLVKLHIDTFSHS